jgi:GT2 family glycosyltransferase
MNYCKEITILIVLYEENIDLLSKNLINLRNFKIIIIDNGADINLKNQITKKFNIYKYIINKKNNGYTKGYNQAIKICDTKYALILEPDCYILEENILKLYRSYQKYNDCLITVPVSYDNNYQLTYSSGYFPENFTNHNPFEISGDTCVQVVLGSSMFFETKKIYDLGCLDENFFIYYSDYDLCRRIYKIKKSIIQIQDSFCTHTHGISKVGNKYKKIFLRENNLLFDELYYFYKIDKHIEKLKNLKKKILNYVIKIIFSIFTLKLEKITFLVARIFAYFRFLFFLKKLNLINKK